MWDCGTGVKCYYKHMVATSLQLDAFIPYRLSFTSGLVSDTIAAIYESMFQLTIPEWRILAWVSEKDGITQQEICALTRMGKVTVSRAAISLTKRGLLRSSPNPDDRRSHLLVLSEEGRKLYASIAPKALQIERQIFQSFDKEELARFVSMLRRIDAIVLDASALNSEKAGQKKQRAFDTG